MPSYATALSGKLMWTGEFSLEFSDEIIFPVAQEPGISFIKRSERAGVSVV